jgi:hypothetical protein
MSKQHTLNVGFTALLDTDGNGFSFVEDSRISASCYGTSGTVTKRLKGLLEREVNDALDYKANHAKRMIGTKNGEVFLIQWFGPTYGYSIAGPGRDYSGSCMGPWKTCVDCAAEARKHAESAFGGIAWECSV